MAFSAGFFLASVLAGSVAALSGFGIGSLLTPLLALEVGTKAAVAAVAVPHFVATVLRFWRIRERLDRRVFWSFGVTSALGGLAGALAHAALHSRNLTYVFGALLCFAGLGGLTGLTRRLRFHGPAAWLAGALSGGFGGLVGNQGGIRAAALMAFPLEREALVATSTAIGVAVDCARLPVYLAVERASMASCASWMAAGTAGVVVGTYAGVGLLRRVPEAWYRVLLSSLILALGVWMLASA